MIIRIEGVATKKCSLAKFRLPIVKLALNLSLILTFLYKLSIWISTLKNIRFFSYLFPVLSAQKNEMAGEYTFKIVFSVAQNFNKDHEKSMPLFSDTYFFGKIQKHGRWEHFWNIFFCLSELWQWFNRKCSLYPYSLC